MNNQLDTMETLINNLLVINQKITLIDDLATQDKLLAERASIITQLAAIEDDLIISGNKAKLVVIRGYSVYYAANRSIEIVFNSVGCLLNTISVMDILNPRIISE